MDTVKKDDNVKTDVAALFTDPAKKAELETFLKEKADVADLDDSQDMMDSAFF